jgi:hypothetical protein
VTANVAGLAGVTAGVAEALFSYTPKISFNYTRSPIKRHDWTEKEKVSRDKKSTKGRQRDGGMGEGREWKKGGTVGERGDEKEQNRTGGNG